MANENRPYVAIIGGFWQLQSDQVKLADAIETAKEIGANLAKAEMGLVVYFSDHDSLEPHVVTGYVAELKAGAGAGSIRVRFAESQKNTVRFAEQTTHDTVFDRILFSSQDWELPFYRSLAAADGVDGVLLMAGQRSTLIAGHVAVARDLPVLAVDKFDGSAGIIRSELAKRAENYPSSTTHSIPASVKWLKEKCESRAKERDRVRANEIKYARILSQRTKTGWLVFAFAALVITLFFGLAKPPDPAVYSSLMFVGSIAAGATGALVRSVFWGTDEITPFASLVLGAIAGFVVAMAYLVPQFVGAPGVLSTKALVVEHTDKIQFMYAVLVAISAGVGFDTIFNRLRKQADSVAVGPKSP